MDSILKKLIADICVDSGLEESNLDKGLTLKLLARRIGTTKLEANIIAGYEKRLRDAEWRIMVGGARVFLRGPSNSRYSLLSWSMSPYP